MTVLLAHALVVGFHVPPALRALTARTLLATEAAIAASFCHAGAAVAADHQAERHAGPDGPDPDEPPADAGDHLKRCPVCLSLAGAKLLGPANAPMLPAPRLIARADFRSGSETVPDGRRVLPYAARAPPAPV
ncbi:DUF2946 family protein [Azospirillum thermophilum]|uniref:DUF2946 family protein n=1 Tax=Azospirillum thermophilum TaxID=2202148 RepID=UPI0011B3FD98|nr:DUF2946 family protein [Azospirillum thermophilum]